MPCDKLKIKEFSGSGAQTAESWWQKFEIATKINTWKDEDLVLQFPFYLSGAALSWYSALETTIKDDWARLKAEFEKFFLKQEPALVTESKLLSRKMKAGETLEEYMAELTELGSKLGKSVNSLATNFLNGLPSQAMRDFVVSTDSHTIDSYKNRARIYLARHPAATAVKFDSSAFFVEEEKQNHSSNMEVINAITEGFKGLRKDLSSFRGRSQYRGRGRGRGGKGHGRSRYRSMSPHGPRSSSKSPVRPGRSQPIICHKCKGENHIAAHCLASN